MTLIAILASLLLERLLEHIQHLRRYERYHDYVVWMRERLRGSSWQGYLGVLALLAPPLLATVLVQTWLCGALFGLLSLLFAVAVLVFCLGPRDLGLELAEYRAALTADNAELATRLARGLLGGEPPEDLDAQARAVTGAVLTQANVRIFCVLFWFAILGPAGAVLYRAVAELCRDPMQTTAQTPVQAGDEFTWAARRIAEWLDWLPARLTAFGYALSGDFEAAVLRWRTSGAGGGEHWHASAADILIATGTGALDLDEDSRDNLTWDQVLQSTLSLVWRTLVLWVFVIALLTLAGWAG
ncbi:MAG: regulatory signaling modulator protein AmpE [Gammaproteobacteria bacterium]|nr:regulatory signaling modulator protein AmpE [Gammaproteobacteria bacterium]